MVTDTKKKPGSGKKGSTADNLLCFCQSISHTQFRDLVTADRNRPFEDLCRQSGLGSQCTSCLLNAEQIYIEETANAITDYSRGSAGQQSDLSLKQRVYRIIDRNSPVVARRHLGIVPIIYGRDVRTVLTASNVPTPAVEEELPTFTLQVDCRDGEGKLRKSHKQIVRPGERADIDVSAHMPKVEEEGRFESGACFICFIADRPGYRGTFRPHFTVETPNAAGTVHSIGRGLQTSMLETVIVSDEERQFVSAVNCTDKAASISMTPRDGAGPVQNIELPARGAALMEIQRRSDNPGIRENCVRLDMRSTVETRWHAMVAWGKPPRISLDHI